LTFLRLLHNSLKWMPPAAIDAFPERLDFTVQNMNVTQHRPRSVHHHFGGKAGSHRHCISPYANYVHQLKIVQTL